MEQSLALLGLFFGLGMLFWQLVFCRPLARRVRILEGEVRSERRRRLDAEQGLAGSRRRPRRALRSIDQEPRRRAGGKR